MAHTAILRASWIFAAALALGAAHAGDPAKQSVKATEDRIEAEYKAARAACDRLSDNAKDVCVAEAKGRQKVAKAELEALRTGKETDRAKVAIARAEANYEVAKERCDDRSGNDRDVCMKEAKAAETRAKADARVAQAAAEERRDSADERRDAAYEAARERCDALSGDAKDRCVDQAKARHGKS